MTMCKPVTTPLNRNHKIDANSSTTENEPTQYRQLIGSSIYLIITRPNLSYSVGLLSQFMQRLRNLQLNCAKRISYGVTKIREHV